MKYTIEKIEDLSEESVLGLLQKYYKDNLDSANSVSITAEAYTALYPCHKVVTNIRGIPLVVDHNTSTPLVEIK